MNILPYLNTKDCAILQAVSKYMQRQVRHRLSRYSIVLYAVDEFHPLLKSGEAKDYEPLFEIAHLFWEVKREQAAARAKIKKYARAHMDPTTFSIIYKW